jgi:hypothetical protein
VPFPMAWPLATLHLNSAITAGSEIDSNVVWRVAAGAVCIEARLE